MSDVVVHLKMNCFLMWRLWVLDLLLAHPAIKLGTWHISVEESKLLKICCVCLWGESYWTSAKVLEEKSGEIWKLDSVNECERRINQNVLFCLYDLTWASVRSMLLSFVSEVELHSFCFILKQNRLDHLSVWKSPKWDLTLSALNGNRPQRMEGQRLQATRLKNVRKMGRTGSRLQRYQALTQVSRSLAWRILRLTYLLSLPKTVLAMVLLVKQRKESNPRDQKVAFHFYHFH